MTSLEVPIFPADLMRLLGISHANTLRRYIKDGKVPERPATPKGGTECAEGAV